MADQWLRVQVLISISVLLWLIGTAPIGKLGKGLSLMLGLTAAWVSVQETRSMIYNEALKTVKLTMQRDLEQKAIALETYQVEHELQQQYTTAPTYPQEVVDELREALEALIKETATAETSKLTTSDEGDKSLYLAIKSLLAVGKSRTYIIEEIFKLGGNNWDKGQEKFDLLMHLAKENNW